MSTQGKAQLRVYVVRAVALLASLAAAYGGFSLFLQFGAADGLDAADIVRTGLIFASTFWLAWGATTALAGLMTDPDEPVRHDGPITGKTAVLIPVYNEDPVATYARIAAMVASVDATGFADRFHFAILSDTRDNAVAARERLWFARLLHESGAEGRLFYRRR